MDLPAANIQYEIIVDIYITGALCLFGIAGNVLSIVVLGRDQTIRRTTGFLLQMLAIADTFCLVSFLISDTLYAALKWTDWLPESVQLGWPYVFVYSLPMASATSMASIWMVVLLTADRYIAICRPLHAAQYSTLPRLRTAVAVIWVLAITFNLPRFFEFTVVEVKTNQVSPSNSLALNGSVSGNYSTMMGTLVNLTWNSTSAQSHHVLKMWDASDMGKSKVYSVVNLCLTSVVRFLFPLLALVFFNQRLVHALRESDQLKRHHSATDGGTGRQHTWMLVVVVIVFVVCQLPSLACHVCYVLYGYVNVPFPESALHYAVTTADLMLVVNSSVNIVIYCIMGRQFRAILLRMISCDGQRSNLTQNTEMDPGRPTVPLHYVRTPHPPEQSQSGREGPTSHHSTGDDAVCRVDVVLDVQRETTFEEELDTRSVGRTSTPQGDIVDNNHRTRRPSPSAEM